jgi:hypothetical protein
VRDAGRDERLAVASDRRGRGRKISGKNGTRAEAGSRQQAEADEASDFHFQR